MSAIRKIGFIDSSCLFLEDIDYTKKIRFELNSISSETIRMVSFPDNNITLFGKDQTISLINKSFDGDLNNINNIANNNIKNGAGINSNKIANGSISNTEFQYLNNLSSNIQNQINALSSSWTIDNSDIYRNIGNVSIGSSIIDNSRLKITGSNNSDPWLTLEGQNGDIDSGAIIYYFSSNTNSPVIKLRDLDNPPRIEFEQIGSGTINSPQYTTWFGMNSGDTTDMRLEGGNLGIGIDPSETLHVSGNIAVTGTVDGRNIASDGSSLDSIVSADGSINTHSDVVITSPQLGQILSYNINNWENTTANNSNIQKFDAYLNTNNSFDFNWTDVNLDIERVKDSSYSHINGSPEIVINSSGNYLITHRCTTDNSTVPFFQLERSQSVCRLVLDTGSGYNQVDGSFGYMYNRVSGAGVSSATVSQILSLSNGNKIKMQVIQVSGFSSLFVVANSCSITIKSL